MGIDEIDELAEALALHKAGDRWRNRKNPKLQVTVREIEDDYLVLETEEGNFIRKAPQGSIEDEWERIPTDPAKVPTKQ